MKPAGFYELFPLILFLLHLFPLNHGNSCSYWINYITLMFLSNCFNTLFLTFSDISLFFLYIIISILTMLTMLLLSLSFFFLGNPVFFLNNCMFYSYLHTHSSSLDKYADCQGGVKVKWRPRGAWTLPPPPPGFPHQSSADCPETWEGRGWVRRFTDCCLYNDRILWWWRLQFLQTTESSFTTSWIPFLILTRFNPAGAKLFLFFSRRLKTQR